MFRYLPVLLLASLVLVGCDTTNTEEEIDLAAEYEFFTNAETSLLLRASRNDGSLVNYYGERDANGFPTRLNLVSVQKPGESEPTVIEIGGDGRPGRIIAKNESVLEIQWENATTGRVVALSPDGQYQATVPFNFAEEGAAKANIGAAAVRNHGPVQMSVEPRAGACDLTVVPQTQGALLKGSSTGRNVVVNVERCAQPVDDALVRLEVEAEGQIGRTVLYGKKLDPGRYQFDIGAADANKIPVDALDRACQSLVNFVGRGCPFIEQITPPMQTALCSSVGAAIDLAAGGPTGEGAIVYAGCMEGIAAAQLYCQTLGGSAAPGAPSPADAICSAIKSAGGVDPDAKVSLKPLAFIPGKGTVSGESKTFPAIGPYSDFTVDASGTPSIETFTVSPSDPEPEEGYVATADVSCLPAGTSVTMSIVGTDGYSNSQTASVTGSATLRLNVPGADGGVVDRVTVTIAGGASKTLSIVF